MALGYIEGGVRSGPFLTQVIQGAVMPEDFLIMHLKLAGDPDMVVDGSSSAKAFKYVVPANKMFILNHVHILLQDASIDPGEFGGIAALSNGLDFAVYNPADAVVVDFTNGEPITTNSGFADLSGARLAWFNGSTTDQLTFEFPLNHFGGSMLLSTGYYVQATVNDALAGLDHFHMTLLGLLVDAE